MVSPGRLDHIQKGKSARGVGTLTLIEIVEVALQIFREHAVSIENIQIRLMKVVEQMLHVERLDLLFGKYFHVLDQELFATNAGMAFADHQSG
ncbi:hypothetical protein D3C84_955740 [compost metagenome]